MPFENFYEESDKADRRGRIALIAIVFLPLVYLAFLYIIAQFQPPEQPSHTINLNLSYEEEKQRVDEICASLSKPEDFFLVDKTEPTAYSRHVSVGYLFRSNRSQEETYPTFILWFAANGWTESKTTTEGLEFRKGNQIISIDFTESIEGIFYGIKCTEWIKK